MRALPSWVAILGLAATGCSLGGMAHFGAGTSTSTGHTPSGPTSATTAGSDGTLTVPDVMGKTLDEARAIVAAAGFTTEPEQNVTVVCQGVPLIPGKISCQNPDPGATARRYTMVQVNVYQEQVLVGQVVRRQLDTLVGLSPDQARQRLKTFGHTGKVTVEPYMNFIEGCGEHKVCGTNHESGLGVEEALILYINRGLAIAPPPPS